MPIQGVFFKFSAKISLLMLFCIMSCLSFGFAIKPMHMLTLFLLLVTISSASAVAYKILIIIISLFSIFYLPIALTYGSPDFNSAVAIYYSDKKESLGFIMAIPWFYYATSLLPAILGWYVFDIKICRLKYRKLIIIYLLISFSSTPIRLYAKDGKVEILSSGIPIIRFVTSIIENYHDVEKQDALLTKTLSMPDNWTPRVVNLPYQIYIMVIGESVRSDYMHAYGFPISNTPFMSTAPGELFTHYTSAASSTQTSLKNTLALRRNQQVELNNNIITLAEKAGIETYWFSNQGSLGFYDTPMASIGKRADHFHFLKKGDSNDGSTIADTDLLNGIGEGIKDSKNIKLIVVHLIGSHPEACLRTNGVYKEFLQSREISCYNQSIRQTDKMLSDVADMAKASGKKWTMMYFSDHGLSFENPDTQYARLLHSDKFKQNFRVPMFITASDSTHRQINSQPRSALNFLSLFTHWLGIKDDLIKDICDMRGKAVCANQDTVIKFDLSTTQFSSLPDDVAAH